MLYASLAGCVRHNNKDNNVIENRANDQMFFLFSATPSTRILAKSSVPCENHVTHQI
jgi:hypothetical protein